MNFFYLLLDDNTLEFRPVSCKPLVVALPNMHHLAKVREQSAEDALVVLVTVGYT
ncbi:MAG TPA: hypothetical protein VEX38_09230 [Fimbriimonadaceae bacterium]|nr:hypothetical protein [Fimbriimonadaceae bacterium]